MLPVPALTFRLDQEVCPATSSVIEWQTRLDLIFQVSLLFQVVQDVGGNQLVLRADQFAAKCPVNEAFFEEAPLRSFEAGRDIRQKPWRLEAWCVQQIRVTPGDVRKNILS